MDKKAVVHIHNGVLLRKAFLKCCKKLLKKFCELKTLFSETLISTRFYLPGRKPKALALSRETLN